MAADREETIQAGSRAELVELLARHRWLRPMDRPRRVPGGRDWFVRVRTHAPVLERRRRRVRPAVVAAVVAGILVALGGVGVVVWLVLKWVAAHWPVVVVVLFLFGVTAAKVRTFGRH